MDPGLVQNVLLSRDDAYVYARAVGFSYELHAFSAHHGALQACSPRTATHINEELLSVKIAERFMYQHVGHNKAAFPWAADNCLLCWAAYNQAKQ